MMCNPLNTPSTLKNKIKNPKHHFLGRGNEKYLYFPLRIFFAQTTKYQMHKLVHFQRNFKLQIYDGFLKGPRTSKAKKGVLYFFE